MADIDEPCRRVGRKNLSVQPLGGHTDFDGWVELLADPLRQRRAYWHLVSSGAAALPAIRRGLGHADAAVRTYCTKALDRLVDEATFPQLLEMLDDDAADVRREALHALACDRCKETSCRPDKDDVLPAAIGKLLHDRSPHVRAMAAEVVGRWVHADVSAEAALIRSAAEDPSPAVRKKAGWYAPGGAIHRRTRPPAPRS